MHTEGITKVTKLDIAYARELGYVIKLLAIAKDAGGAIEVRVHPTLVPARFLLATVGGAFNAIYVRGDAVGPSLFYGLGAGSLPTASAVVGDVMELARRVRAGKGAPAPPAVALAATREVLPMDEVVSPCYVRIQALDKPGVLAAVAGILARHEISIASVIQKEREKGRAVPIVLMTHEARGAAIRAALEEVGEAADGERRAAVHQGGARRVTSAALSFGRPWRAPAALLGGLLVRRAPARLRAPILAALPGRTMTLPKRQGSRSRELGERLS